MLVGLQAYGRSRLNDRAVNELLGMAHGLIADGEINQREAECLRKWLQVNALVTGNPVILNLLVRISAYLTDGDLDDDEAADLFETLRRFTGGKSDLDDLARATELPIDEPPPGVAIPGRSFCFTGTFAYGSRRDCHAAVERLGGIAAELTKRTHYLVVGVYATGSWAHSSFGRKIEKAMGMKADGAPIAIVSEKHWASFVRS